MILVVGPGAVGGTLACRWRMAGLPVAVAGRSPARERLLARGVHYAGRDGKAHVIKLTPASSLEPKPRDAVFICVKSYNTKKAIRRARPWVGPETVVVAVQNGIGHERSLHAAFGRKRTVLASAYFGADRSRPNAIRASWGNHILLAQEQSNAEAVKKVRALLLKAGWKVLLRRGAERILWSKACFNAATNPLGALCRVPNGDLYTNPALKDMLLRALREGLACARKAGHPPAFHDPEGIVLRACKNAPTQRNSMLQDLEAGRPTEIDAITAPLLQAGRRHGVRTPVLSRLTAAVKGLERELSR